MLAPSAHSDVPTQPPGRAPSAPGPQVHDAPPRATPVSGSSASDPVVGRSAGERRTPPAPAQPARSKAPSAPDPAAAFQPGGSSVGTHAPTKLVDEQAPGATAETLATVQPLQPEIEIRDVRREEGPSAWVSSVGRLLARHAEDGLPFAVLLVEIVDVAQLERSETPHDLHGLVAKVESALGQGMRASDHLSRETLGRYWLVAPETNGTGRGCSPSAWPGSCAHPPPTAGCRWRSRSASPYVPRTASRRPPWQLARTWASIQRGRQGARSPTRTRRPAGLIQAAAVPPAATASGLGIASAGHPQQGGVRSFAHDLRLHTHRFGDRERARPLPRSDPRWRRSRVGASIDHGTVRRWPL